MPAFLDGARRSAAEHVYWRTHGTYDFALPLFGRKPPAMGRTNRTNRAVLAMVLWAGDRDRQQIGHIAASACTLGNPQATT
jgi:hypothetical protein